MDKKFLLILTLIYLSFIYCKEECFMERIHTFEVEADVKVYFGAEIRDPGVMVIDINYENKKNDRLLLSSKKSYKNMHNGKEYTKTELDFLPKEGWNDVAILVGTTILNIYFTQSSVSSSLVIDMHPGIKSLRVSAEKLKICEESCGIENDIVQNINNEEKFRVTAFTTSEYPITFKISDGIEGRVNGHLEMKPRNCIYRQKEESIKIPCDNINPGWNELNIFVNRSALIINNNVFKLISFTGLKTVSISGSYLVNCTKGTPVWKISKDEVPIPLFLGQEIVINLTSTVEFSPVFNFGGNKFKLNWNNGLKFGSSGNPLLPNRYQIILKANSESLLLYNKEKLNVIMELKIDKALTLLKVSSVKGEYKLSISVNIPSQEPSKDSSSSKTIWLIIISVLLSLAGIVISITILFKRRKGKLYIKKINAFEEGISLLPMEDQDTIKNTIRSSFTEKHGETNQQMSPHNKEVCKIKLKSDNENEYKKRIGLLEPNKKTKTILVVGQTGSGKSSFINAMVNNVYGVEYEDSFRFKLIDDTNNIREAHNSGNQNTDKITAYYIPHMRGIKLDCNYVFIDTPGFGNSSGFEEDKRWNVEFHDFLKKSHISEVDAICFVIEATKTRLTLAQDYIIKCLFSNFGKDIKNIIYPVVSYSDGFDTNVPVLLLKSGLDYEFALMFNSVGIYNEGNEDSDSFEDVHKYFMKKWKFSMRDIDIFFGKLEKSSAVCLSLTNIVLEEYEDIEKLKDELLLLSAKNNDATDEEKQEIQSRIEEHQQQLMVKLDDAQKLSERLKDIPLKENPLDVNDYIDELIQYDKTKISGLQKLKERNTKFDIFLKEKSITKSLMEIILPRKTEKTD